MASLIIGMGLPTTATYIVMASLTAPAIVTIGGMQGFIVPLMAAHLFCFYFGILADDTPPVGLAAYAAAAIAKSPPMFLDIHPLLTHPNLDIWAGIYDSSGTLIAQSNPSNNVSASFTDVALGAGKFFLRVEGVGTHGF